MKPTLRTIRTYSVIAKGSLQTVYRKGEYVYKEIKADEYQVAPKAIISDIKDFYRLCNLAGIPTPRVAQIPFLVKGNTIVNKYSYEGAPLLKYINSSKLPHLYKQLLTIVNNGLRNNLGISTFHEQFVSDGNHLIFIDFFVPATLTAFGHYKKGQQAKNYYLTHFSKNSVVLSGFTDYWILSPKNRLVVESIFNGFLKKKSLDYPLAAKTKESKLFRWCLKNSLKLGECKKKWLLIRGRGVILEADDIDSLIKRSKNTDLFVYQPIKRVFAREEIVDGLLNYTKLRI